MLKKLTMTLMLAMLLMGAGATFAAEMPVSKWWNNAVLTERLNLTAQQKALLDEKYIEARRRLIQMKGDLETQRFELEVLLEQDPLDEPRIMDHFRMLESLRAGLVKVGFEFILDTRRILGVERFRQLKAIHDQVGRKKGRKGEERKRRRHQ